MLSLAATGHRPATLHLPTAPAYSPQQQSRLLFLAEHHLASLPSRPDHVISGMALGWDLAVAQAAINLSIPLICAIPFPGQTSRWTPPDIYRYLNIKKHAAQFHIISPQYTRDCMQKRNIWMIDHADAVIALFNGSPGGTANCLRYAVKKNKPITNLWPSYKEICRCP